MSECIFCSGYEDRVFLRNDLAMLEVGFKYCALHYLNQWLSKEREYCDAFASNDEGERLEAIRKAVTFYGIARNLPTVYDTGAQTGRYKLVLDIIDVHPRLHFREIRSYHRYRASERRYPASTVVVTFFISF